MNNTFCKTIIDQANICEDNKKYIIHQLKKIHDILDEKYDIYPISVIQAIFDGISGTRLDVILARCNSIYLPWLGTREDTLLQVPKEQRRIGLIVAYRDYNNFNAILTRRGEDVDDINWVDETQWEGWDWDKLIQEIKNTILEYLDELNLFENPEFIELIKNIIEYILNNITEYPGLNEYIKNIIKNIFENINDYEDLLNSILSEIYNVIKDILSNLDQYPEFNEYIKNIIKQAIENIFNNIIEYPEFWDKLISEIERILKEILKDLNNYPDILDTIREIIKSIFKYQEGQEGDDKVYISSNINDETKAVLTGKPIVSPDANKVNIHSNVWGGTEGKDYNIPGATESLSGVMIASDKTKLNNTPFFITLTQAEYDALPEYDSDTMYIILDNSEPSTGKFFDFKFEIETTEPNQSFKFPVNRVSYISNDYTTDKIEVFVDWGRGGVYENSTIVYAESREFIIEEPGIYTFNCSGTTPVLGYKNREDALDSGSNLIINILSWGYYISDNPVKEINYLCYNSAITELYAIEDKQGYIPLTYNILGYDSTFYGCKNLNKVVSIFNGTNIKFNSTFQQCSKLDYHNVINVLDNCYTAITYNLFASCGFTKLYNGILGDCTIESIDGMFAVNTSLLRVEDPIFENNSYYIKDGDRLFDGCTSLSYINDNLFGSAVCQITSLRNAFFNTALTETANNMLKNLIYLVNCDYLYAECRNLITIYENLFNIEYIQGQSSIKILDGAFRNCEMITSIPNTLLYKCVNLTSAEEFLDGCKKLTNIDADFLSKCVNLSYVPGFFRNSGIEYIHPTFFDNILVLPSRNNGRDMFTYCKNLTIIERNTLKNIKSTTWYNSFLDCSNLTNINDKVIFEYSDKNIAPVNLFKGCINLVYVEIDNSGNTNVDWFMDLTDCPLNIESITYILNNISIRTDRQGTINFKDNTYNSSDPGVAELSAALNYTTSNSFTITGITII